MKLLRDLLPQAIGPGRETSEKDGFGGWSLERETLCVVLRDEEGRELYDVDLERCRTSAAVLDWIFQVAGKTWADDRILAGLIRVLDRYLDPQGRLCSGGIEGGPINVRAMLR